jgi:hypothetical protein
MLAAAQRVFDEVNHKPLPSISDHTSYLDKEAESMRWFLLPSEAQQVLLGVTTPTTTPPFQPRRYPALETQYNVPNSITASPTESASLCNWKSKPEEKERITVNAATDYCDSSPEEMRDTEQKKEEIVKFHCPPKNIYKPTTEVIMLHDGWY